MDAGELFPQTCLTAPPNARYDLYLYDYALNDDSQYHVYGYLRRPHASPLKLRLLLHNWVVYMNVMVNPMYEGMAGLQHEQMERVLAKGGRGAGFAVFAVCEGSRVFKGAQDGVHIRYEFADFSQYQKFKAGLRRVNAQWQAYRSNPD